MAKPCIGVLGGFAFPNCQGQLAVDVTAAGNPVTTGNVTLELSGGKLGDTPVPMGSVRHYCPKQPCFFFLSEMECSVPSVCCANHNRQDSASQGPNALPGATYNWERVQVGLVCMWPDPDTLENIP